MSGGGWRARVEGLSASGGMRGASKGLVGVMVEPATFGLACKLDVGVGALKLPASRRARPLSSRKNQYPCFVSQLPAWAAVVGEGKPNPEDGA